MDIPAITQLRHEWERASRTARARIVLTTLIEREADLAMLEASTFDELVQGGPAQRPQVASWKVTAALMRQFDLDELVGLGLLVRLTPGLLAMARALDWGQTPPWRSTEAFAVDIVSTTWEVLHRCAGASVAYPERTVLRTIRRRLEDQRAASRRQVNKEESVGDHVTEISDPHPISVLDELTFALRSRRSTVTPRDLQLVYSHRVLGLTFPELAAACGASVQALEQRSYRAEAALCA